MMRRVLICGLMFAALSCGTRVRDVKPADTSYAEFFSIPDGHTIVSLSPYGASPDTLRLSSPAKRLVCMSSSHVAFLDAIGMNSCIAAVSGLRYISSDELRSRDDVFDVGYDPEVDFERILSLNPDLVISYSVSSMTPPYVERLRQLGVRVLMVNEHLESHPLARAEYVRLFGVLTGRLHEADSVFSMVEKNYSGICRSVSDSPHKKVLVNVPYADQWYVPGGMNYMTRLISDAGGEVLGCEKDLHESSVISLEKAYSLAKEADVWLNPGSVRSREELFPLNPVFSRFGIGAIYNNTLRTNSEGGNDFWESGCVRPDLILEDLVDIFSGSDNPSFNYYIEVD